MMLGAFRASLPAGESAAFILGSATASCLWFLGLTGVLSVVRRAVTQGLLLWINRVCGCVILYYGCRLLCQFVALCL